MARYPLNLPAQLKKEAEEWAAAQGISLNQFILWAVAEKVGALKQQLDDPAFPRVTYRRGASGQPVPVLRGTGIRVQTVKEISCSMPNVTRMCPCATLKATHDALEEWCGPWMGRNRIVPPWRLKW